MRGRKESLAEDCAIAFKSMSRLAPSASRKHSGPSIRVHQLYFISSSRHARCFLYPHVDKSIMLVAAGSCQI